MSSTQGMVHGSFASDDEGREDRLVRGQLGMWVFIGTEVLFFSGLLFGYALARSSHPAGFALASRHTEILIGTVNTVILLCSSAAIAFAAEAMKEASCPLARPARLALWLTVALGVAFLALKGVEYAQDWRDGLFPGPGFHLGREGGTAPGAELFFVLYYVMTAIHALHLAIGIGAVLWLLKRWQQMPEATRSTRVEVTALYWHFVDVVWVLLYPLLYLIDRS